MLCTIVGITCVQGSAEGSGSATDNTTGTQGDTGALTHQPGTLVSFLGDPCYPDDFWKTATLLESGVDRAGLAQAVEKIANDRLEIHAFLVVRNGRLVFEQYGWKTGRNADDPDKTAHQVVPAERHLVHSTTKSITSTLVGIALSPSFALFEAIQLF
jgi:hypothetical protein